MTLELPRPRAFQLDAVSFWIANVNRRPFTFRAIAQASFINGNSKLRQMQTDCVLVKRIDGYGNVVHVPTI